jgi:hypothetical protein
MGATSWQKVSAIHEELIWTRKDSGAEETAEHLGGVCNPENWIGNYGFVETDRQLNYWNAVPRPASGYAELLLQFFQ